MFSFEQMIQFDEHIFEMGETRTSKDLRLGSENPVRRDLTIQVKDFKHHLPVRCLDKHG